MVKDKNGNSYNASCTVLGHVATFYFTGTVPAAANFSSFAVTNDEGEVFGSFLGFTTIYRTFTGGFALSNDGSTYTTAAEDSAPDDYVSALDKINAWSYGDNNDEIDGAKLHDESITADKIEVDTIFSKDLDVSGRLSLLNGLYTPIDTDPEAPDFAKTKHQYLLGFVGAKGYAGAYTDEDMMQTRIIGQLSVGGAGSDGHYGLITCEGDIRAFGDVYAGKTNKLYTEAEVKNLLRDVVRIDTISKTGCTLPGNASTTITFDKVTFPTGYKMMTILGGRTSSGNIVYTAVNTQGISGNTMTPKIIYRNLTSTQQSNVTCSILVAYIKDI